MGVPADKELQVVPMSANQAEAGPSSSSAAGPVVHVAPPATFPPEPPEVMNRKK